MRTIGALPSTPSLRRLVRPYHIRRRSGVNHGAWTLQHCDSSLEPASARGSAAVVGVTHAAGIRAEYAARLQLTVDVADVASRLRASSRDSGRRCVYAPRRPQQSTQNHHQHQTLARGVPPSLGRGSCKESTRVGMRAPLTPANRCGMKWSQGQRKPAPQPAGLRHLQQEGPAVPPPTSQRAPTQLAIRPPPS